MATQASAITFLSTPGQGYVDGMSFIQNYLGLPIALIIVSSIFVPIYYKSNVYTDITVLNTVEMSNTKVDLDQFERAGVFLFLSRFLLPALTKFRPEADKDRFERMIEFYSSAYNKEFQTILEDGVNYDSDAGGSISTSEREPLHSYRRLTR